ncbi:MAG: hypothetical protein KAS17_00785, partial [Victivallaceae bacterium]|nr:hypothetical protein [Victivallaceae bacterium]
MGYYNEVINACNQLGTTKALFVFFFLLAHGYIWWLYKGRLKDRQTEIDRMATENKEFRKYFMTI